MAILRRPGSVVVRYLTSDSGLPEGSRGKLNVRVPSEADYRELLKLDVMARAGQLNGFEILRQRLGVMLESIENIYYEDGSPIILEKDGTGRLTPATMAALMPLVDEISSLCDSVSRITEQDAKN